jgi:trigger factor
VTTKLKRLSKGEVEIRVELTNEELERFRLRAARTLSQAHPVKGFRPGEAPVRTVEDAVGKERFFGEVLERAVRAHYLPAFEVHQLTPAGPPQITLEKSPSADTLAFTIQSTVLPEIALPSYERFELAPETVEVGEAEIEKALRTLQRSRATFTAASRGARKGDRVEIDFDASIGGVPVEGGSSRQHPLIAGEGHFMEGFEEALEGMHEGETKSFSLTAPKDYYDKNLAGKLVDFRVTMRVVEEVHLPSLDDSFARALGKFPDMEALRKSISEGLYEEKVKKQREKIRLAVVEQLIQRSSFAVPPVLIDREIEVMFQEFSGALERMGMATENYLATIKKTVEDLRREWRDRAEKRVRAALLLRAVAEKEGVHVAGEEIEERLSEMTGQISDPHHVQQLDLDALREQVRGTLRNEKVLALLEKRVEFR